MKLLVLSCPNCKGELEIKVKDQQFIFCPYCGEKFILDDEKKEYTINKNIHIKKDINVTKNYNYNSYDEADVIRAKTEAREKRNGWKFLIGLLIFLVVDMVVLYILFDMSDKEEQAKIDAGMISAGEHGDYEGENYEAVVEQLTTLGFTNIKAVDLDDAGIKFWKDEKVESVSVGGDNYFFEGDLFNPNSPVIVTYH